MQSIENRENAILSNVKEKIVITEAGQQSPEARGEVAAQEQMRVVRQTMTYRPKQSREPKTRGEVAAQEQIRILNQVLKM